MHVIGIPAGLNIIRHFSQGVFQKKGGIAGSLIVRFTGSGGTDDGQLLF